MEQDPINKQGLTQMEMDYHQKFQDLILYWFVNYHRPSVLADYNDFFKDEVDGDVIKVKHYDLKLYDISSLRRGRKLPKSKSFEVDVGEWLDSRIKQGQDVHAMDDDGRSDGDSDGDGDKKENDSNGDGDKKETDGGDKKENGDIDGSRININQQSPAPNKYKVRFLDNILNNPCCGKMAETTVNNIVAIIERMEMNDKDKEIDNDNDMEMNDVDESVDERKKSELKIVLPPAIPALPKSGTN